MTRTIKALLWFVVLAALAAVAGAVVTGGLLRDVEVEEEPYEAGLRWDADRTRMSELGWSKGEVYVEFKAGRAILTIELSGKDGEPLRLRPEDVSVVASRPAGDLGDMPCSVDLPREGQIRGVCDDLPFGHWDFIVNINTDKGPIKLMERTYVKKKSY